jgi:hypothetical protein
LASTLKLNQKNKMGLFDIFKKKKKVKCEVEVTLHPENQNHPHALFQCDYCDETIYLNDKINHNIVTKDNKKYHKKCWRKKLKGAKRYVSTGQL